MDNKEEAYLRMECLREAVKIYALEMNASDGETDKTAVGIAKEYEAFVLDK